jgi:hypothetical protein
MGVNNRDRRRQKKRRLAAAERARARHRAEAEAMPGRGIRPDDVEAVLAAAVCAQRDRNIDSVYELTELLAEGPPGLGGEALVDAVVARCTRRDVGVAADRGWEWDALERVIRRRLGKSQARVLSILDDAPGGAFIDDLADALHTYRASAIVHVVEVLAFMASLPPLPKLRSAERPRTPVDGRILERVRALLAKAESTTFPEEAEALSTKAQELMARHAIDRALLDATAGIESGVSGRRLAIDDPYAKEKSLLLARVAHANRCTAIWEPDVGWSTVFGAEDDLDIVDLLFTSLLCQATGAMTAAGSTAEGALGGQTRTRSFRQSFLVAYATRIGARLRDATETVTGDAVAAGGSECLLPVLAARRSAAEAAAREAFPELGRARFSAHDPAGWAAGTAAADVADLNTRRQVGDTAG